MKLLGPSVRSRRFHTLSAPIRSASGTKTSTGDPVTLSISSATSRGRAVAVQRHWPRHAPDINSTTSLLRLE